MLGHWFVVASQKTVKVFTETPQGGNLKLLKLLDNPLGREKKSALIRKQAGSGIKSNGRLGAVHYSESKRHDPHDQAALQFAREVVQFLDGERLHRNFETLTVVAEPHFLGKLKAKMKSKTEASVIDWIKKDLQKIPVNKLPEILKLKQKKRQNPKPPKIWKRTS